jgi:DNA-directed RNA polymerase sigma subunit (sigma70/sigma32)
MSEIASEMEEKLERIEKISLLDVAVGSFDHGLESDGEQGCSLKLIAADQEEDARDQEESMARVEFATRLINALPDEEQKLIKQKYGIGTDPMTIKEIAAANETSQKFIKQEYERIMSKIKPVAKLFAIGDLF